MALYKIEWRKSTKKDFKKLPQQIINRVITAVEALSEDPYPQDCKKLTGSEFTYRIRVGDYRVIYEVYEGKVIIEVIRVRHRKAVYRK